MQRAERMRIMGRYYRLSRKVTDDQAKEIEREMKELTTAEDAEIFEGNTCLKVVAAEEKYPEVMGQAVNICKRKADDAELSFAGLSKKYSI